MSEESFVHGMLPFFLTEDLMCQRKILSKRQMRNKKLQNKQNCLQIKTKIINTNVAKLIKLDANIPESLNISNLNSQNKNTVIEINHGTIQWK